MVSVNKEREPETWRAVVGYEGLYEISSYGKLKRLAGSSVRVRDGYKLLRPDKIMKCRTSKKGHRVGELYFHDGEFWKRKNLQIHRLVAIAFIGNPPDGKNQVKHINGDKNDDYFGNLEWCNNSEQQNHARELGLRPPNAKSWDYAHSLPVNKVDLFSGMTIETYGSFQEAERETGIPHQNIRKVCQGKRITAGGFSWEYAEKAEKIMEIKTTEINNRLPELQWQFKDIELHLN